MASLVLFIESDVEHMEWEEGLGINGGTKGGYSNEYNLLTCAAERLEVSHHLAHAYSAAAQCPFRSGMVVVMDGMGDTWRMMKRALESGDGTYLSDLTLSRKAGDDDGGIRFVPSDIEERVKSSYFDWREAESFYTFSKDKRQLSVKIGT